MLGLGFVLGCPVERRPYSFIHKYQWVTSMARMLEYVTVGKNQEMDEIRSANIFMQLVVFPAIVYSNVSEEPRRWIGKQSNCT